MNLIEGSLRELPKYADTAAAVADGYTSIGDAGTGSEHYIKASLIPDDVLLDATQPESLVYTVKGDERRCSAGAMYIASARPTDDPSLTDWAGPLMQWHNHGRSVLGPASMACLRSSGVIDDDGNCARGVNTGGENPMVHVWITPHPCGVFAALEGVGAGQTAVPEDQRVDMCRGARHMPQHPSSSPSQYDPTQADRPQRNTRASRAEQQAAAENLIAVTWCACRSGPTTGWPRPPASPASVTR